MRKAAISLTLLLAALSTTGCSAVEREYPSAEPAALRQRLTDRAQWAYEGMALPRHETVTPVRVIPGHSCSAGGLSIEKTLPDVVTFDLSWTVEDVPVDIARTAEARLRKQFASAGWTVTHDGNRRGKTFVEFGFRVQDPKTGDTFDLDWNDSTTSLFLSGYTPCAKVPRSAAEGPSPDTWAPQI
ncbi:hypothetical protein [Streptomyces sp. NPDC051214]|uniref:hypothetical protein n=1 Tax=Streptomyces sp. NPDC051214 TaxID=3155282 RepID=UPI00342F19ED